ncbi:T9SS type A sorting domain-containing protein [Polaribacter pectinis]|uniref:T9SS type A sorting domain-containing protein n=1 Tax=Polaribacter pectinis TaxID=2738844 RepID=A0A7G9L6R5_9FLAO|nr:carbohydrate binding domain-containing protein [Polaribacter pectinis]QNM84314.1 T9SS type A sorting domain-containing protein [Polaribacter pectinis]
MKKLLSICCLFFISITTQSFIVVSESSVTSILAGTDDYIINHDFEQGMTAWNDWNNTLTSVASEVHSGTNAGKIKNGNGSLQQAIYLKGNTTYQIKFWARSEFNNQTATIQVVNNATSVKYLNNVTVNTSTAYAQYSYSFTTDGDANTSTVSFSLFKWNAPAGAIYADDFEITETGSSPDQIRLINTDNLNAMQVGFSYQAEAVKIPLTASTELWEIVDGTGSATIDQSGLITAVSEGTITLKVSYVSNPSISDQIELTISPATPVSTYYIDATNGLDTNDGLSESNAWQTVSKVNNFLFMPGDQVLFKSGETWTEQLIITRKGAASNPITYTSYGTGNKPKIAPTCVLYAVEINNASYTVFDGFDVSNNCGTVAGYRYGIAIIADNEGDIPEIIVKNNDVHDVAGDPVKSNGTSGGIRFRNQGAILSRLVDLQIIGNHIYDCERNGINGSTDYWSTQYGSLRVYVAQNLIERVPGDGIVMHGTEDSLCEYNICRDFTNNLPDVSENAAAGIWPFNSINCTIQYNEVSGHIASWDAQGFDSDWRCENTIIQYNYSHDNAGGFCLVVSNGLNNNESQNKNSIIRYNISINDGYRTWGSGTNFAPSFHIGGPTLNTQIYNNTIYYNTKPSTVAEEFVHLTNWNGWPDQTHFKNNLFVSTDPQLSIFRHRQSTNNTYSHNLYYGNITVPTEEANALTSDPLFVNPGLDNSPDDYKLETNSPAKAAGVIIPNNGGLDFFGNTVPSGIAPTIGAHELHETLGLDLEFNIKNKLFSVAGSNIVENAISINTHAHLNKATVQIISLTGSVIYKKEYKNLEQSKHTFNLYSIRGGLYFLNITTRNSQQTIKFIKK